MGDPLQSTLVTDFIVLQLAIPVNGAPVTLQSLITTALTANAATAAIVAAAKANARDFVAGVKFSAPSAAFQYRRVSGGQPMPIAAGVDWTEPIVGGPANGGAAGGILQGLFDCVAAGPTNVTALIYLR